MTTCALSVMANVFVIRLHFTNSKMNKLVFALIISLLYKI